MKPCRTQRKTLVPLILFAAVVFALVPASDAEPPRPSETNAKRLDAVQKCIAAEYDSLDALYKHLHSHPELSYQEEKSAARMAKELKDLGFEVTEKFGGHGVVGMFKNGKGPTVLVRTDMDALPVSERTNLPYASKVRVRDKNDNEVGVMHACGHDIHMTCAIGVARVMVALKDQWLGTLIVICQPAEEVGGGAKSMLREGLFTKFPRPDYALALHCDSNLPYGSIGYTDGMALANVDSVDITIKGKGGHGSAPHTTVDPIVLAARVVLDLQTIVSRETNPLDPAVVTVGSIHGGTKHNIIPDEVKLQLTVRTTKDSVRKHTLESVERITKAAAQGAGAPEPDVKIDPDEFTPALVNESKLTRKTTELFTEILGADKVVEKPVMMGGEDFGRYGRDGGVPIFLYFLGTQKPEAVAAAAKEGKPLPSLHSDRFAPVPEPTIKTGVTTMSMAVLNLMGK